MDDSNTVTKVDDLPPPEFRPIFRYDFLLCRMVLLRCRARYGCWSFERWGDKAFNNNVLVWGDEAFNNNVLSWGDEAFVVANEQRAV